MGIELRDEDVVLLNEYSDGDFAFNIINSIETARQSLEEKNKQHYLNDCQFESNKWKVVYQDGVNRLEFKFDKTIANIQFTPVLTKQEKIDFVQVIKCWVAHLLDRLDIYSVHRYLRYLNSFLEYSNCFNPDKITLNEVKDNIYKINEKTKHSAFITCLGVLNFLDYYPEIDPNNYYTDLLLELKEEIGMEQNVRTLPKPKDVFLFDKKFDEYFNQLSPYSPEYIYFFPIYLWWKLTNKVPLRPFEFCGIKLEGFFKKDDQYFIKLPRSDKKGNKKRNTNRIQIIDTIKIPNDLGDTIELYKLNTQIYGESETLLSAKACRETFNKVFNSPYTNEKLVPTLFSVSDLYRVLDRYYEHVIVNKFGLTVRPRNTINENTEIINDSYDISFKIKPGDTRHFAFINLMKLGYNPVEIARLGGHLKLKSQYHYQSHEEFLVDIEILQVMNKFSYEKNFSAIGDTNDSFADSPQQNVFTEHFALEQLIKDKFVRVSSPSEKRKKLNLGYCKDPLQRCKVNDCPLCDSWGISIDEYRANREAIVKKAEIAYNHIKDIVATLIHIHKYIIREYNKVNDVDDLNINLNRDLTIQSKKFNQAIEEYIELATLQQRKVDYNG